VAAYFLALNRTKRSVRLAGLVERGVVAAAET
jgi:hypothetical protein